MCSQHLPSLEPAPRGSERPTPSNSLTALWPFLKGRPLDLINPVPDPWSLVLGARIPFLENCGRSEDIFACFSKPNNPDVALALPLNFSGGHPACPWHGADTSEGDAPVLWEQRFLVQLLDAARGTGGRREESRGCIEPRVLTVSPDESVRGSRGGRSCAGSDEGRVLVWHRLRAAVGGRKTATRLVAAVPNQALGHTV